MPGINSLLGVCDTKAVKGRARENEARELLQKIANQVKPICVAHKWTVQKLEEFIPPNAQLLGMNVGRQKIFIRLRPAGDLDTFYSYEALLHTMLHELVHMEINPHNAKFYKMLDELRVECEKLMREGITGTNMPFAGDGRSLGGGRAPIDARTAALKAAEKRQRQQGIMGSGQRLGGSTAATGSAAERAAAAAEWRQAVSTGCVITGTSGCHGRGGDKGCSSSAPGRPVGGSSDREGWDCELCTLHNSDPNLIACEACGTARPASTTAGSLKSGEGEGRQGAKGSSPRAAVLDHGRGLSHAKEGIKGREGGKRSRYHNPYRAASGSIVAAAGTSSGRGAPARPSSSSSSSSSSAAAAAVAAAGMGGFMLGTWTCRQCPFAFPNAAERETCESCGVRKDTAGNVHDNERRRAATRVDAAWSAGGGGGGGGWAGFEGRTVEGLVVPWTCSVCTVINPETFLVCGTCQTSRESRIASAFSRTVSGQAGSGGGDGAVTTDTNQDDCWNRNSVDGGSMTAGTPTMSSSSSDVGRTCAICTLRNNVQAVVCVACGFPLRESAVAEAAAVRTGTREERVGTGAEVGRLVSREEVDSRGDAVSFASDTEIIDLS